MNGVDPVATFLARSDRDLIEACKRGEQGSWDRLFLRFEKPVFKMAYRFVRNAHDAEDLVSIVFLRLYTMLDKYHYGSHFTTYLFVIVRNAFIDTRARDRFRLLLSLDDPISIDGNEVDRTTRWNGPAPEARLYDDERRGMLAKTIHHLPDHYRSVVILFYLDGRSYEEVALIKGLSVGTVKSRLSRARSMLRKRLEADEDMNATLS
jgi:RNA polymerase sigma-70 factor, ECF subfamily